MNELILTYATHFLEASLGRSKYIVVFIGDFNRKSWTFFLKAKSGTFEKFKNFKNMIEDGKNKIRMSRIDRGGNLLFKEFNSYYEQNGIRRQLMTVETPHQNGVAEWKNRTILE